MKILLSPAKKLSFEQGDSILKATTPVFMEQAQKLENTLKKKSVNQLKKLMSLSDDLAQLNFDRNQVWGTSEAEKNMAIYAFRGDVFRGLDVDTLGNSALHYLENHLIILSGLYGFLKPSDTIEPYRLEMGTKLKIGRKDNLYEYWKPLLSNTLKEMSPADEPIVSLASNEYEKAVDPKVFSSRFYRMNFKENRDGKLKSIFLYIKEARGKMLRFIAENNIQDVEHLKGFDVDGYLFSPENSTDLEFTFIRG